MRRLSILKTITYIMFRLALVAIVFTPAIVFMTIMMPKDVPFKFSNKLLENSSFWEQAISYVMVYIGFAFQVYALYLFDKTLDLFKKRIIFDDKVIRNFDQMGKAIVIGYFIMYIPFLFLALTNSPIEINLQFMFNDSLLILGLGFFFMVLSEVFQKAKNIKEENELTV